jgi:small nuclear ribonucleoprotein (snRNP)-like protein
MSAGVVASPMQFQMENPEPFLHDLHGKVISVMLKWGWELRGILQSKDEYMNLLVPLSLSS